MDSITRKIAEAGRDEAICRALIKRLQTRLAGRSLRFMEVCGTHTVSIFQSGLRSLLPESVIHISGPGCPVCVTHESEVALILELSLRTDIMLATFGDLMRVPGPEGRSLRHASAAGANVEIVYSPLAALDLAAAHLDKKVVFIAVGFETTAPAVAASIMTASTRGLKNFHVLCLHKLVAPALRSLLAEDAMPVDALLLPGHVATITGLGPFEFIAGSFHKPCAVSGFEPADILLALCELAMQLESDAPSIVNAYSRSVARDGNPVARRIMEHVFMPVNSRWRGLGLIEGGGLAIRPEFSAFDAMTALDLSVPDTPPLPGCICGSVLRGTKQPRDCRLFAKSCTPATPVGPCMVSTEGSCAAWFKYGEVK